MPELLLELFSEEIPARMQRQAAEDLRKLVTNALVDAGVTYEGAQSFATPRRLTLHIVGLPAAQPDRREERKGPRVGAPEGAIQGFLKAAGLTSIDQARKVSDGKKGEFYAAVTEKKGRLTPELLTEIVPGILRSFPWPKSMRWGAASTRSDALRWVRPLRSIVCTFAERNEAAEVVAFTLDGLTASDTTEGHRFLAPGKISVRRFDDYVDALSKAKVVLSADRRKQMILTDALNLAFAQGLELVEDEGLLEEVAGLVEWPVVLMGEFEEEFLEIPPEVIRATIRANQKCFVLRDEHGKLANKFILVSNLVASDGGAAIAAGNGRVVRARLSDARHFWRTDLGPLPDYRDAAEKPLDQRLAKLNALGIVFHEKLGTQGERIERIATLAAALAPAVGCVPALAERAARLAKADLVTEMVGEFPELQGLMGRYYAEAQGEDVNVAQAIEEHYKPQGPNDRVPTSPESIAVALADKLDTLVGFWAIDEKPTGSKDPYALRRAALGILRILIENELRISLAFAILESYLLVLLKMQRNNTFIYLKRMDNTSYITITGKYGERSEDDWDDKIDYSEPIYIIRTSKENEHSEKRVNIIYLFDSKIQDGEEFVGTLPSPLALASDLLAFFADRLKVYLREKGARHDLIDAVFALPGQDDLLMVVRRVEALGKFLETEDGKNLLVGYRRAANILKAEEKKDGEGAFAGAYEALPLNLPQEQTLADALASAGAEARECVAREDFEAAMRSLAALRAPVDDFFVAVTVNAEDKFLRVNRLRLLGELREAVHAVADFSKVAG